MNTFMDYQLLIKMGLDYNYVVDIYLHDLKHRKIKNKYYRRALYNCTKRRLNNTHNKPPN